MSIVREYRRDVMRRYRRKRSREGRLELLGRLLARAAKPSAWLPVSREDLGFSPAEVAFAISRTRRLVSLLAAHAGRMPYRASQEQRPSRPDLDRLPKQMAVTERRSLHERVEGLLSSLGREERRLVQWRYGVACSNRLPEHEIARRLGVSERTVRNRLRAALAVLNAMD